MVFKLTVAVVALAALASAANFKRVACPDGKNSATHEAVCIYHTDQGLLRAYILVLAVLRVLWAS